MTNSASSRCWRWAAVLAVGAAVWAARAQHQQSAAIDKEWRLLAIFAATIAGLVVEPIPGGAIVLLALIASVVSGTLTSEQALGGFVDSIVWLVLAAFLISRAFIKTGLAKRIALSFIWLLGHNSLGLGYALAGADIVLAGMIPSNAARVGGVILPIARSIAELYKSLPGASAHLLGCYLIATLYQIDVMACALYITGQASNVLAAGQARTLSGGAVVLDYARWFQCASVPALTCLALIPWLMFRLTRPTIVSTPKAAEFAREELRGLGRPRWPEIQLMIVFGIVCALWIALDSRHTAIVALGGVAALLIGGVITWDEAAREHEAWNVFIWYGGLVQLGKMLHQQGLMELFAQSMLGWLHGMNGISLFVAATIVYFFAHYCFASITTHIVSMFAAFAKVLLVAGLPAPLVLTTLPMFTNFSAGLTHYGTTPGPILFATGYVSQSLWWRVGLILAFANLSIWFTVGLAWWKLLGLW